MFLFNINTQTVLTFGPTNYLVQVGELLRGAIVIRTHNVHKSPYISLFSCTVLGPDYYVPPY